LQHQQSLQHLCLHLLLLLALCLLLHLPQVIAQYVLDRYSGQGPSMVAADPESRAIAALATRIHDQYITPIQVGGSCLCRHKQSAAAP
jgi:hypothetical protein